MLRKLLKWGIYNLFLRLVGFLFIKRFKGAETLPKEGGYILCANHASYLDIPVLSRSIYASTKKEIRYLTKKELFYNPISRYIMETGRGIPIDRDKKDKGALEEAIRALKKGEIIGIYPEGGRTLTGKLQKGKTGVARLALWARVPVVPVGIKGTFEILPKGKTVPLFRKTVVVTIGKPISFEKHYGKKMTKKLLRNLTNLVMNQIAKLLKDK